MNEFRYIGFISYNKTDVQWGWRLQKKLEKYKLPADLSHGKRTNRKPLKPIFFAPSDIQPGELTEELKTRLKYSKNLIVICSPNSAKSQWVSQEIDFFANTLNRKNSIFFFIVKGEPNSEDPDLECYNPVIRKLGLSNHLGVNINEKVYRLPWLNKERAYIQLISKLLTLEFDSLWKRHQRLLIRRCVYCFTLLLLFIGSVLLVWDTSRSIEVRVDLIENELCNPELPPTSNVNISIDFPNETKSFHIEDIHKPLIIKNVPKSFINSEVHVALEAQFCYPSDTTFFLQNKNAIVLNRDKEFFGHIIFRLWGKKEEAYLKGVRLNIDGKEVITDNSGTVILTIPYALQKTRYSILSDDVALEDNTIIMPCSPDDIVIAN